MVNHHKHLNKHQVLSETELSRIAAVVGEVEKTAQGEIVPMVVSRSGPYQSAHWRLAISICWMISAVLLYERPDIEPWKLLALQVPFLWVGWLISKIPPVLRAVLSRAEVGAEVHRRALEAFYYHHLHLTVDQSGILIFISCFDRRVVILADEGIHSRVEHGIWDQVVQRMLPMIKIGDIVGALEYGVKECGKILAAHLPAVGRTSNQLSNRPILGD